MILALGALQPLQGRFSVKQFSSALLSPLMLFLFSIVFGIFLVPALSGVLPNSPEGYRVLFDHWAEPIFIGLILGIPTCVLYAISRLPRLIPMALMYLVGLFTGNYLAPYAVSIFY